MVLLPQSYLDCVVAILRTSDKRCIGSGFLYGHHVENTLYRIYLVTNRHVLQGRRQVILRFNPEEADAPAREFNFNLFEENQRILYAYPDNRIDVAIVPINVRYLKDQEIKFNFFRSDKQVANIEKLVEIEILEGDFVYVLGFPMGLIGEQRNVVIARSGIIARIRDTLNRTNPEYLIDAFVFPGNSGGPVVNKPETTAIIGTKSQPRAYLIGIVKSYLAYEDIAISTQTRKPRVIFQENSGLTAVHPIDYVQELVREHLKWLESQQE